MRQKGFTLIEILVALPIAAAILVVVVSSFFQIVQGRVDIAQKSIAISDIDNAVHWLTRDLILAQETSLTDGAPPTSSLTISWSDLTHWAEDEGVVDYSASYVLSGNQLVRTYNGEETIVGRYLTDFDISLEGKMFTVVLTSQPGMPGSTVTRSFSVEMRSDLE